MGGFGVEKHGWVSWRDGCSLGDVAFGRAVPATAFRPVLTLTRWAQNSPTLVQLNIQNSIF